MIRHDSDRWTEYKGTMLSAEGALGDEIRGALYISGFRFEFSLTKQKEDIQEPIPEKKSRKYYLYRGSLRIKINGKILKIPPHGSAEAKVAKHSLYSDTDNRDTIQAYIIEQAEIMALEFADVVYKSDVIPFSPETITPQQAALKYVERFVKEQYDGAKPDSICSGIKSFFAKLEPVPMAKFSTAAIRACIKDHAFGKNKVKWAQRFWAYCLKNQFCTGADPFPAEEGRKRRDPKKLQAEAVESDALSPDEQDLLYDTLEINASDYDCGIALMGSGFSYKEASSRRWKHILFDPYVVEHVNVAQYDDEIAGATHELTRPCIPPCARILIKAYTKLRMTYSGEELSEMYVVGGENRQRRINDLAAEYADKEKKSSRGLGESTHSKSNQKECMKKAEEKVQKDVQNDLSKLAAYRIQKVKETLGTLNGKTITADKARSLLENTYVRNLILRCGMDKDFGSFAFLAGRSLARDVSSSHYVSFVAPCASDRLYTTIKVLDKERPLLVNTEPRILEDGKCSYEISPRTTLQNAGMVVRMIVPPGKHRFEFGCEHGATGTVRAYRKDDDEEK